jgi:hypothetical protein
MLLWLGGVARDVILHYSKTPLVICELEKFIKVHKKPKGAPLLFFVFSEIRKQTYFIVFLWL